MECKNCGAQWALRAGMPQPKACPFCGAALAAEPPKPAAAVSSSAVVPGQTADDDDWFVETAPPPGLAMDDAVWERYLQDTPPAPRPAAPQPAAPRTKEGGRDETDRPECCRVEGDPFREELEAAAKDWEKKGWGKVITADRLEAGKLVKLVRRNYQRCRVTSLKTFRVPGDRSYIICSMQDVKNGRTVPFHDDPNYQYTLYPSGAGIRNDQLREGMELIYGANLEREDTLYRIDTVDRDADGAVAVSMTDLAGGSAAPRSFRPDELLLEVAAKTTKMRYVYYNAKKDQHIFVDLIGNDDADLRPEEVGRALPFIEAAEVVHEVTRCTLDGRQTDLWAEVTLRVLSTAAMAAGRDLLATTKNGLQFAVPNSIVPGDLIRVDTRTGAYMGKTPPEELPHARDVEDDLFRAEPIGGNEEGYSITEYIGRGERQAVVPAQIGGQPIAKFSMDIFAGTEVESVTVSEGIREISRSQAYLLEGTKAAAKYLCQSLTRISLPNSVTAIGDGAFAGCPQLGGIELPIVLKKLGEAAFKGCAKLTSIQVPVGVQTIQKRTFQDCAGLTSVQLPEGLQVIERDAFARCAALSGIKFPKSLTRVESYAFYRCGSLAAVVIQSPQTDLDSRGIFALCPNAAFWQDTPSEQDGRIGVSILKKDFGSKPGRTADDPFRPEFESSPYRKRSLTTRELKAGMLVKKLSAAFERRRISTFGRPADPVIHYKLEDIQGGQKALEEMGYREDPLVLWPDMTITHLDQVQDGAEVLCRIRVVPDDTLYRVDAVRQGADGGVEADLVKLADGSKEKRSFRRGDRFLRLAQVEQELMYEHYDEESGKHVFLDPETFDSIELSPAEVGKALPCIEAAEAVHGVTRCMLDGKQTDLWAEVTLRVLSTAKLAAGAGQLAATKNDLQFWVPDSIAPGDYILVDTRTGTFLKKAEDPHD